MPNAPTPTCSCRSAAPPGRISSPARCLPSNCGARRVSLPTTPITAKDDAMRGRLAWGGIAIVALAAGGVLAASAQTPVSEQQQRLVEAKAASQAAAERSARLERAAANEKDQALQARAQEAAVAAHIQQIEADI